MQTISLSKKFARNDYVLFMYHFKSKIRPVLNSPSDDGSERGEDEKKVNFLCIHNSLVLCIVVCWGKVGGDFKNVTRKTILGFMQIINNTYNVAREMHVARLCCQQDPTVINTQSQRPGASCPDAAGEFFNNHWQSKGL